MSKSEVERHKTWEHPVPVSPFEDRFAGKSRDDDNNNSSTSIDPEALYRLTSDVAIGSNNNSGGSSSNRGGDITSSWSSTTRTIGGEKRRTPFKPFKI